MAAASSRPPDTARLPHLQQRARRADRRLLIGSAALAVAGLVLALRGPPVPGWSQPRAQWPGVAVAAATGIAVRDGRPVAGIADRGTAGRAAQPPR
ncbi:hypothetical protein G6F24_017990 [Rhizopus arrhizus]|nr:hypothetical protein G6F24_017990 [Rhizopus arrhizus]